MDLRPYQTSGLERIRAAILAGKRRILVASPTGSGKTVLASEGMIRPAVAQGNRVLFIAHRVELIEQCAAKLAGLDVGIIKAGHVPRPGAMVQVASIQTLARRLPPPARVVIWDECFPAGTLIDQRPIESCRVGDDVTAFDEDAGELRISRIAAVFRSRPQSMVRVRVGGSVIDCTLGHPFLTRRGWKLAGELTYLDEVADVGMQCMRRYRPSPQAGDAMPEVLSTIDDGAESKGCPRPDAQSQPDAHARRPRADGGNAETDWTQALRQRRERERSDAAAAATRERAWVADGGNYSDGAPTPPIQCASVVQGGYSQSGGDDGNRSGRRQSLCAIREEQGSPKGGRPVWTRVEGVAIHESTSDGTFGGVCPDGYVYNIEVEKYHTYIVGGCVVHNCHHATAESYLRVAAAYPNAVHIGLTATPYRTGGKGLAECFDALVEICNIPDLMQLGFLVPVRTFAPPPPDLTSVHTVAGDYSQAELAVAVDRPGLVGDVVATYRRLAAGRKAIVFAVNVAHSIHLTAAFLAAGIGATHLDGETPADKRREVIYSLGNGSLEVIVNCGVLTEGTDIPAVSAIILARPTKSRGLWKQMVGRGLRPFAGKGDCILLDHAGCHYRHGLVTDCEELSLEGVKRSAASDAQPVKTCMECYAVVPASVEACPQCGAVFPVVVPQPIATVDGELTEAGATAKKTLYFSANEKTELDRLVTEAVTWRYKAGWIGFRFRNAFHRWPAPMAVLEAMMTEEQGKRDVQARMIADGVVARL